MWVWVGMEGVGADVGAGAGAVAGGRWTLTDTNGH